MPADRRPIPERLADLPLRARAGAGDLVHMAAPLNADRIPAGSTLDMVVQERMHARLDEIVADLKTGTGWAVVLGEAFDPASAHRADHDPAEPITLAPTNHAGQPRAPRRRVVASATSAGAGASAASAQPMAAAASAPAVPAPPSSPPTLATITHAMVVHADLAHEFVRDHARQDVIVSSLWLQDDVRAEFTDRDALRGYLRGVAEGRVRVRADGSSANVITSMTRSDGAAL